MKNKKAIIYDLDNTLFDVKTIGDELFATLFKLIEESGKHNDELDEIKDELMRRPYQAVAEEHDFSKELTEKGTQLLRELTYEGEIHPFDDYDAIKKLPGDRYLVTTGFKKLQWSKIKGMGIEDDFTKIYVVDPDESDDTKEDIFKAIMQAYHYQSADVLVVGDDPDSEIKFAKKLGIDTVLIDKDGRHHDAEATWKVGGLGEIGQLAND
jgi:putative hydrolase of the HAD superfamily